MLRVVIYFILASGAAAGQRDTEWNPPAPYDHPYSGRLIERSLPQPLIQKACDRLFARYGVTSKTSFNQHGCSAFRGKVCEVIVPNRTFMGATPEAVRRHEIGHCNGWPASHPN